MNPKRKPSLGWLVLAPLLFILGVGGGTAILIHQIMQLPAGHTFQVPSVQTIDITEPGTYLLWHNNRIEFEGTVYNKAAFLPDQTVIRLEKNGQVIPPRHSWDATTTSGNHQKIEVGRYDLTQMGAYRLSVSGFTEPHVFSFGRSALGKLLMAGILCLILNLIGWFGTPLFIALIFILRSRSTAIQPPAEKKSPRETT
jgi:hypothetical protein